MIAAAFQGQEVWIQAKQCSKIPSSLAQFACCCYCQLYSSSAALPLLLLEILFHSVQVHKIFAVDGFVLPSLCLLCLQLASVVSGNLGLCTVFMTAIRLFMVMTIFMQTHTHNVWYVQHYKQESVTYTTSLLAGRLIKIIKKPQQ